MRWTTGLLVLVAACKGGKHDASSTGSAAPPPVTPPVTAPADAAPSVAFSQAITADGIGPVNATIDPAAVATLFPGLTAKTEHSESNGRSLDTTSLAWPSGVTIVQLVVDNIHNELRADALGANFATAAGIRVGSTVTELVGAYSDAECKRETVPDTTTQVLYCSSASLPNIQFHLDPSALTGSDGKVPAARVQSFKVTRVRWTHARPQDATAPAGGEAKALCLSAGNDLVVDRIVATADSVTFCAPGEGSLSCAAVSLATGEVTMPASPPAKPAEPDSHVDTENARKLQRGEGGVWTVLDTKSSKTTATLKMPEKDHACIGDASFVGPAIYVEAQVCDKHESVGYLFKPTGEVIGRIDGVNLYKSRPFMIDGDRALLHSSNSEDVLFIQVSKAKQAMTPTVAPDEAESCCPARVTASVPPFAKLPGNKVVSIGASVAVLDPETGALEKHFVLPTCK